MKIKGNATKTTVELEGATVTIFHVNERVAAMVLETLTAALERGADLEVWARNVTRCVLKASAEVAR